MQVQVHIGFHKSGTTALQTMVKANASLLPAGVEVRTRTDASIADLRDVLRTLNSRYSSEHFAHAVSAAKALFDRERDAGTDRLWLLSVGACGSIPRPDRTQESVYQNVPSAVEALKTAAAESNVDLGLSASTRDERTWIDSLYRHHLRNRGLRMTRAEYDEGPFGKFRFDDLIRQLLPLAPDLFVFRMEDDIGHRLGVGVSLLRHLGISDDDMRTWQPNFDRNSGIGSDTVAYMNRPLLRLLPAPVRVALARRHSARRTR